MASGERRGFEWPLLVVVVIAMLAMVALDRPLARGDGLAYFMWLDSIAGDGDMDLGNQAHIFAHINTYQVYQSEETGAWGTDFAYGSALLLAPAYWLAQGFERLGWLSVNPDYFIGLQGRPFVYSFLGMLAVNLYALGALVLAYRSARIFARPVPSAAAALFLFLGTPLLYYATIEPFYVHVPATFLSTLTLYLLLRGWQIGNRDEKPPASGTLLSRPGVWYVAAGLTGGLATLVRWQMALLVCAMALPLLLHRRWRGLVLFAAGFWAVAWHVLYTWQWMFGRPKLLTATETGFLSLPVHVPEVLFSDGRGLFIWSPLTLLGVVGLVLLGRRWVAWAFSLGAAFALQVLINGGVIDWWGGWSFGMRRMTELYPIFVLGLAYLLNRAAGWPRAARAGLWTLVVLALAFSLLLLLSHLNFINTVQDQPQGDRATTEIRYQLTQSNFDITWQVIEGHYGPWAWDRPGP